MITSDVIGGAALFGFITFLLGLGFGGRIRNRYWERKAEDGTRACTPRGLYHVTLDQKFEP